MADGSPRRWIMRQAMIELFTGSERDLLDQFLQAEAMAQSDDPFASTSCRIVWSYLVAKAIAGEVEITGHHEGGSEGVIPAGLLVNARPDFHKQALSTDIGVFLGVLVKSTVMVTPMIDKQNSAKAGPEPRHGDDFIQEMLRFALLPDGFETRKQLETHMKQWCSQVRGDARPDDRTIERWVARYCPMDIPTK